MALNGFVRGLGEVHGLPSFSVVPWSAWTRTLAFWIPLALALWIGLIGLSLVVHRQWSEHEQLPYPQASFTNALLPGNAEGRTSIFRNKLFWLGFVPVLFILVNDYLYTWFPRHLVYISLSHLPTTLRKLSPLIARGGGFYRLNLFPLVVGFAYFVSSDVSFSIGISQFLWGVVNGALLGYGISLSGGGMLGLQPQAFLNFGAYFGALLALVYTGRYYYAKVFRGALFLPSPEPAEPAAVWGARVFLVCAGLFAANLVYMGLDWPLAVLYTALIYMLFVVIGRIVAESGMFYVRAYWYPGVAVWGLLGSRALGPKPLIMMLLVTAVLAMDTREAFMPFVVNSLKVLQLRKVRLGRPALWSVVALLVGLAVAIPVTLAFQYNTGAIGWGHSAVEIHPKIPFDRVMREKQKLEGQGSLEEAQQISGLARFARIAPSRPCAIAFAVGLAAFLAFTAARLRWHWWPIHPILFLLWGRTSTADFAPSFLVGWFVKVAIIKYGGTRTYQRMKPLMIGLIAGCIVGAVIQVFVAPTYYFATSSPPKVLQVMPY